MIAKKIEYLLWLLGADNTQLAAYANCSESNFSRLRSGSRTPSKSSQTVKRFASAVCDYAKDRNMEEELCKAVCCSDPETALEKQLIEWLYDGSDPVPPLGGQTSDLAVFGQKLSSAMDLISMTNSRLSRAANVDPSYISRMRSGTRLPKSNPRLIERLCSVMVQRAYEQDKINELEDLIGAQKGAVEHELTKLLFIWLYDRSSSANMTAVRRLIDLIDTYPQPSTKDLPKFESIATDDILADSRTSYVGLEGLRSAVVRLLSNAANTAGSVLWLYSDQSMEWMHGDYAPVWMSLMRECLDRGIRVHIIHNIDRSVAEMVAAINYWMPLYFTGLIVPYYSTKRAGERFSSTIFISRGREAIVGSCVKGMEPEAVFGYYTDPVRLERCERAFETLLKDCRPLLKISREPADAAGSSNVITANNLRFNLNDSGVIITKLTEPRMSFSFEHPVMSRAFLAYAESLRMPR